MLYFSKHFQMSKLIWFSNPAYKVDWECNPKSIMIEQRLLSGAIVVAQQANPSLASAYISCGYWFSPGCSPSSPTLRYAPPRIAPFSPEAHRKCQLQCYGLSTEDTEFLEDVTIGGHWLPHADGGQGILWLEPENESGKIILGQSQWKLPKFLLNQYLSTPLWGNSCSPFLSWHSEEITQEPWRVYETQRIHI